MDFQRDIIYFTNQKTLNDFILKINFDEMES